ncbi:hypothetical protein CO709_27545 [Burkholderia thailandensis]|nr:hypothetical protein CO709_27545 [Burkholderia thailandensis]
MKRPILYIFAALVLTLPIYTGIANIPAVDHWFTSGAGWEAFEPIFKAVERMGFQGEGRIIIASMLLISFLISLLIVLSIGKFASRNRTKKA